MKKIFLLLTFLLFGALGWGQTTVSYDFSDASAVSGLNEAAPGITLDSNIGFGSFKNEGTANPTINSGQLRLYQDATKGGSIKIYASNGVTITKVVVHASIVTGPAAYTVDGGLATDLTDGSTYTMSNLSATNVVEFYQKDSSDSNRIYVDSFDVTYTADTSVSLASTTYTQTENGTSVDICVDISNPDANNDTTVDLALTSSSLPHLSSYTTQSITFPAGSNTQQCVTVNIEDNSICDGNADYTFELQDVSGGNNASIGTNSSTVLTVTDDEMTSGEYKSARFEGSDNWGYTTSASIENDVYTYNDSNSLRLNNSAKTIEFDDVSIAGFSDVSISVAFASKGVDSGEDLYMDISYDGGANYTENIQLVDGYSNLSTNINTTNAHTVTSNPYTFDVPAGKTSVKIRFRALGIDSDEYYYIDDVILTRSACNTCTEPTTDASFHADSPQNITGTSVTLNWSNGNGDNRIVVLREDNPVNFVPTDGTSYTANANFGTGTDVGTGEYVIYNGNGSTVDVTGLTPGKLYYAVIYEYSCTVGNEDYYTGGTPTTDSFLTEPENPASFQAGCMGNTSIDLNWTAPANGVFDSYLLVVREGATPHGVNSTDPSSISGENLDYTSASTYGSTTPNSRYLYKGTNTNVTVTGLTTGTSYTFKLYAFSDAGSIFEYSTGTTVTKTIGLNEVISPQASTGNTEVEVGWTNPDASCFDEVMIVANETAGISFTPSGDGSAYTADANYTAPNQVIYKGTGTNVTVTGLTNGTTYYFEIFVRKGTEWSSGVEVSGTPTTVTILEKGDLAIVAINTQHLNNGSNDEVCFFAFKDITPGTAIDFTDNGYERLTAGEWGDTEGTIRMTYNGNTNITKGTVICIQGSGNDSDDFTVLVCGINDNDNWTISSLNGSSSFDLNVNDQIWIMQNGNWINPPGSHDATYTGNILYGWTATGWKDVPGYDDTKGSTLPPGMQCFNTDVDNLTAPDKVKFTGNLSTFRTQKEWVLELNDSTNWTGYTTNSEYYDASPNYSGSCIKFNISGSGYTEGMWTGSKNTNWFDCSNWDNLTVPDENTDVIINSNTNNNGAVIDANATDSDLYNNIAKTKNLLIQENIWVKVNTNKDVLEIHGDLTIANNAILDANDDDNTTMEDGQIKIYGNWTNNNGNDGFDQGNSTVTFMGTTTQTVTQTNGMDNIEKFYNLTINNPQGVTFASGNIHAEGVLTLSQSPDLSIPDGKYILAGNGFINNGINIVVENEGNFIQTDENATITDLKPANYKLKKISNPLDQYYEYVYWSSPIKEGNLKLGDIVNNAWGYYEYDPADNSYPAYPGWIVKSSSDLFQTGLGYAISAPNGTTGNIVLTPEFTSNNDPFNSGNLSYTLRLSADNDPNGDDDYNLIGNPYPSALDFDKFATDNTNIEAAYYAWTNCAGLDVDLHHQKQGYTIYSVGSGGTKACSNTELVAGRNISTAQGFMVEAIGSGTIRFENTHRSFQNNNFINKPVTLDRFWLDLTNSEGGFNQILVAFSPQATDQYDRFFDAHHLDNGNGQEFYSINNNEKWAIQGLPDIAKKEEYIIPIGLKEDKQTHIKFHLNKTEGIPSSMFIYLHDKENNNFHLLNNNDLELTVDAGTQKDRFEIILRRAALETETIILESTEVKIFQNNNLFRVRSLGEKEINRINVFLVTGQQILELENIKSKEKQFKLNNISKGNILIFSILLNHKYIQNIKYIVK